jgi:predicted nucleic acid-binding protein
MAVFHRFQETKKIRTISFDTNVISDILYYYILERKGGIYRKGIYAERLSDSAESVILSLAVNVKVVGIDMIRKELKRRPLLAELYAAVFESEIRMSKEIRWLARKYKEDIRIGNADSLIMASASVGKIDLFLSWNRDDIVNDSNLERIKGINKKRGVSFPVFATPQEFLDRFFLTQRQTIGLSQLPSPRQFHPKIFWTR